MLTNLTGIYFIQNNIPKNSPTNNSVETLTFRVTFSLADNNKYSMSTNYGLVIVVVIKRNVTLVRIP